MFICRDVSLDDIEMKRTVVFLLCLICLSCLSCSGKAPEILDVFPKLVLVQDRDLGIVYEELSCFIRAQDEDGTDDFDVLYIINDDAELFWRLDPENWVQQEQKEEAWIGSNTIRMADYGPLPRGTYRVLLVDVAGKRAEREITLKEQEEFSPSFPSFEISDHTVLIRSVYKEATIWMYDDSGNFIRGKKTDRLVMPLEELIGKEDAGRVKKLSIYVYDSARDTGLVSEPYDVP